MKLDDEEEESGDSEKRKIERTVFVQLLSAPEMIERK